MSIGSVGGVHRGVERSHVVYLTLRYSIVHKTRLEGAMCRTRGLALMHRYFQHAHFIPIVGVGKRGEY